MGFLSREFRSELLSADDMAGLAHRDKKPVYNDTSRPENRLPTPQEAFMKWRKKQMGETDDEGDEASEVGKRTNEEIQSAYDGI